MKRTLPALLVFLVFPSACNRDPAPTISTQKPEAAEAALTTSGETTSAETTSADTSSGETSVTTEGTTASTTEGTTTTTMTAPYAEQDGTAAVMELAADVRARGALSPAYRIRTAAAQTPAVAHFPKLALRPRLLSRGEYVASFDGARWSRIETPPPVVTTTAVAAAVQSGAPIAVFPSKAEYRSSSLGSGNVFRVEGITVEFPSPVVIHELRANALRLRTFVETVAPLPSSVRFSGLPPGIKLRVRSNGRKIAEPTTSLAGDVTVPLTAPPKRFSLELSAIPPSAI